MPPGGKSRRMCGGGNAEGLPHPWPDGRAPPPHLLRKIGYLRVGARPQELPLPSPFQGHLQSSWEFGASGSPAHAEIQTQSTTADVWRHECS